MGGLCGGANTNDETELENEQNTNSQTTTEKKTTSNNDNGNGIEDRYHFGKTLGKGASCRVVQGIRKKDKLPVAIKIMSKEKKVCTQLYKFEIDVLKKLNHDNIIQLIHNEEDESNYYVITKLCEGGELFDRIVSPQYRITEKIAAKLVSNMLAALKHCHDQNIVHRDLKPENFVFESDKEDANLVLIDFGCAKVVEDKTVYKDLVGTVYYLAPELAAMSKRVPTTGEILKLADLWSLGVITYVLITGRPPFKGRNNREIFTRIIKDPLQFPDEVNVSDGFKDFVNKCLKKNPWKRLTLDEALAHPWVTGQSAADYQLNKDVIRYLKQFAYQSKLKKAITRTLAANMSKEPENEVRKHFERLDKDGDGHLDEGELQTLLLDMGYAPVGAKKESKKILESADVNKDGTVDFNEFKAIWHRKLLSQHEQYIHRVFCVFDDNGDGQIDKDELAGVLGDELPEIVEMIKEVDDDGNGQISFEEFKKAMLEDTKKVDGLVNAHIGQEKANPDDRIETDDLVSDDNTTTNNDNDDNKDNDE